MSELDLNNSSSANQENNQSGGTGVDERFDKILHVPSEAEKTFRNLNDLPSSERDLLKNKEDVKLLQGMLKKLSSSGLNISDPGAVDGILAGGIDSETSKNQSAFLLNLLKENNGSLVSFTDAELKQFVKEKDMSRTQYSLVTLQKAYNKEFGKQDGPISVDGRYGKQTKDALSSFFKEKIYANSEARPLDTSKLSFVNEIRVPNEIGESAKEVTFSETRKEVTVSSKLAEGMAVDISSVVEEIRDNKLSLLSPPPVKNLENMIQGLKPRDGVPVDLSVLKNETPLTSKEPNSRVFAQASSTKVSERKSLGKIKREEASQDPKKQHLIDIYDNLTKRSTSEIDKSDRLGLLNLLPRKFSDFGKNDIAVIQSTIKHIAYSEPDMFIRPGAINGEYTSTERGYNQVNELSKLSLEYGGDLSKVPGTKLYSLIDTGHLNCNQVAVIIFQKGFNAEFGGRPGFPELAVDGIPGKDTTWALKLKLLHS